MSLPGAGDAVEAERGGVYQGTTTVYGWQPLDPHKLISRKMIECVRTRPEDGTGIIVDAVQVRHDLRKQYGLK